MTKQLMKPFSTLSHGIPPLAVLLVLCFSLSLFTGPVRAQEGGQIQENTGRIEPGDITLYVLPDLRKGQKLAVRAQAASGNLDPLLAVIDGRVDPEVLETAFEDALGQASADGLDPLEEIEALRDRFTLAWDDDSGGGLTAALELEIPADGDYRLMVAGALSVLTICLSMGRLLLLSGSIYSAP